MDGNGFYEEIGEMLKMGKSITNAISEKMNFKNSILNYVRYKQLNWYDHMRMMNEKRLPRKKLE